MKENLTRKMIWDQAGITGLVLGAVLSIAMIIDRLLIKIDINPNIVLILSALMLSVRIFGYIVGLIYFTRKFKADIPIRTGKCAVGGLRFCLRIICRCRIPICGYISGAIQTLVPNDGATDGCKHQKFHGRHAFAHPGTYIRIQFYQYIYPWYITRADYLEEVSAKSSQYQRLNNRTYYGIYKRPVNRNISLQRRRITS